MQTPLKSRDERLRWADDCARIPYFLFSNSVRPIAELNGQTGAVALRPGNDAAAKNNMLKILIIDDTLANLDMVQEMLLSQEFEVATASNGEVGIEKPRPSSRI